MILASRPDPLPLTSVPASSARNDSFTAGRPPAAVVQPEALRRRMFGQTGLRVSELCLGTLNFGWRVSEVQAFALLDAFRAAGGNFIQATAVGGATERALQVTEASEDYVGRWWQSRAIKREDLFLATRIVLRAPRPQGAVAMDALIRRCGEQSPRRLRVSYLDLLLIEWSDDLPPVDDVLLGLGNLKRAGLVRYFGAAGFPPWRLMETVHRAILRGWDRFEVAQADYSLLVRGEREADLVRWCRDYRCALLARSPLAGGALVGRATARGRFNEAEATQIRGRLAEVARRHGATVPQVALAWLLRQPVLTAPVLGAGSLEHLRDLLAAPQLNLTGDDLARLEPTAVPVSRGSTGEFTPEPIIA